jgi:hypothetical protein
MSSIDKLALTCRVLYDQRLLEQRKEIEKLQVHLFFKDYTGANFKELFALMNLHTSCKCNHCKRAGRFYYEFTEEEETACTFGPWLDKVLHERGFVVLRQDRIHRPGSTGPFEAYFLDASYEKNVPFIDADCHLVELIDMKSAQRGETICRWEKIGIGKRLWTIESIDNQWIQLFKRVFTPCIAYTIPLSSPPTPPSSPKMAPQPRPPLPITSTINQGLELQELKKQFATLAAEMQTLKEQLATLTAEKLKEQLEHDRDDTKRKRP